MTQLIGREDPITEATTEPPELCGVCAVLLVGVAALGPIVGGPGLGELIFSGLRVITSPNAVNLALMGTLGVVLVGMLLDGAFLLLSRATTSKGLR